MYDTEVKTCNDCHSVYCFVLGSYIPTNCYLVVDNNTKRGVIIDTSTDPQELMTTVAEMKINVRYIINTHGHFDHVSGNEQVKAFTGAKLLIHHDDAAMLTPEYMCTAGPAGICVPSTPDILLSDGDSIELDSLNFTVLHTPGHTPGGISLLFDDVLFSGDTLFRLSVGRTDFAGGDTGKLLNSIKNKLYVLPDETQVLPGHDDFSVIGDEKRRNPFTL